MEIQEIKIKCPKCEYINQRKIEVLSEWNTILDECDHCYPTNQIEYKIKGELLDDEKEEVYKIDRNTE